MSAKLDLQVISIVSHSFLISILVIIIFSVAFRRYKSSATTSDDGFLPSPPKLPIIGNLHQLGTLPHRSLRALACRYGPLMRLDLGQTPTLIVSSPRLAQEIMKTYDLTFSDRPRSGTFYQLLYNGNDLASAPHGEYWRHMRSICVMHLLNNRRVQSFSSVREEEIEILLEKIEHECRLGVLIDLVDMFALSTNNIICRVALGRKYCEGEEGRRFKRLLEEFVELLGGFNVGDFIPSLGWVNRVTGLESKVKRVAKEFDEFLERVIEEHIASHKEGIKSSVDGRDKDLVDVLLEVQRDGLADFPFSRINIKGLLLDIFAAGADTTYTLLEWAMTELFRNPGAMTKLQDETRNISNGRTKITEQDLDRMPYLKSVFKETLRLHPPIPLLIPRVATRDVSFHGYDVAAGTMVITNAWAIGRDETSWDRPEEFIPERFLGGSVDYKGQDFKFIPFGSGRRGCPGVAFTMAVNELMLANLVNRFNWALPEGVKAEDLDMTECTGITVHKKVPLLVAATPYF